MKACICQPIPLLCLAFEDDANCGVIEVQHYKITSLELQVSSLEDAVISRIAARDAL